MSKASLLSIDHLSVAFSTRDGMVTALNDVSLSVAKGEVVGIVGESGSGKSVTAYSVIGLLERTGRVVGGTASYDGIALVGAGEAELSDLRGREISMVFQNPRAALNPIRTIGRQIQDVLLRHAQATRTTARAAALALLEQVRVADPTRVHDSYPFELSGGLCQRAMIAIALACDPRLLIADEPTTGLDVTTQKASMDLMRELTRQRGMAVILITHDLGLAASYCDRIVVMQKGQVVESAPVAQLFGHPTHPYTRKLIAASPGPQSRLADLTAVPDELEAAPPPPAPAPQAPARTLPPAATPLLDVIDLVKLFPRRGGEPFAAVDHVSFSLGRGESLGLVGESGCGKSTTSAIITRLMDPSAGTVMLDGLDLTATPAARFARSPHRAKVQMVFQDPTESLNPRHSAARAIAEPLLRLGGMRAGKALDIRIEELADQVGLPRALLTRFPHQMSGGQKARIGIARAIALQPAVLILDEPTSALDVSVQAVVLQLLDRLKREMGMSYVFVSHDLNVVRLLCERVVVMNRGRVVEQGAAEQVLSTPADDYTRALIAAIPHFRPELLRHQ